LQAGTISYPGFVCSSAQQNCTVRDGLQTVKYHKEKKKRGKEYDWLRKYNCNIYIKKSDSQMAEQAP